MATYKSNIDLNHCKNWLLRAYVDSKITGHYVCSHFGMKADQMLGVVAFKAGISEEAGLDHMTGGRVLANLDEAPTTEDAEKLLKAYNDYKAERRRERRAKKNGQQLELTPAEKELGDQIIAESMERVYGMTLEQKVDYLIELAEKLAKVWGCKT